MFYVVNRIQFEFEKQRYCAGLKSEAFDQPDSKDERSEWPLGSWRLDMARSQNGRLLLVIGCSTRIRIESAQPLNSAFFALPIGCYSCVRQNFGSKVRNIGYPTNHSGGKLKGLHKASGKALIRQCNLEAEIRATRSSVHLVLKVVPLGGLKSALVHGRLRGRCRLDWVAFGDVRSLDVQRSRALITRSRRRGLNIPKRHPQNGQHAPISRSAHAHSRQAVNCPKDEPAGRR